MCFPFCWLLFMRCTIVLCARFHLFVCYCPIPVYWSQGGILRLFVWFFFTSSRAPRMPLLLAGNPTQRKLADFLLDPESFNDLKKSADGRGQQCPPPEMGIRSTTLALASKFGLWLRSACFRIFGEPGLWPKKMETNAVKNAISPFCETVW